MLISDGGALCFEACKDVEYLHVSLCVCVSLLMKTMKQQANMEYDGL